MRTAWIHSTACLAGTLLLATALMTAAGCEETEELLDGQTLQGEVDTEDDLDSEEEDLDLDEDPLDT